MSAQRGQYSLGDIEYKPLGPDPVKAIEDEAKGFGLRVSSGARSVSRNAAAGGASTSKHLVDDARDLAGDPEKMSQFYRHMRSTYGPNLNELYYDPEGGFKKGQDIGAIGGHGDHVHVSVAQRGQFKLTDAQPVAASQTAPNEGGKAQALLNELKAANPQGVGRPGQYGSVTGSAGTPQYGSARGAAVPIAAPAPTVTPPPRITVPTSELSKSSLGLETAFSEAQSAGDKAGMERYGRMLKSEGWEAGPGESGWWYVKPPSRQQRPASQGIERFVEAQRPRAVTTPRKPLPYMPGPFAGAPEPLTRGLIDTTAAIAEPITRAAQGAARAPGQVADELRRLPGVTRESRNEMRGVPNAPSIRSSYQSNAVEQGLGQAADEINRISDELGLDPGKVKDSVKAIGSTATLLLLRNPAAIASFTAAETYGRGASPVEATKSGLQTAGAIGLMGAGARAIDVAASRGAQEGAGLTERVLGAKGLPGAAARFAGRTAVNIAAPDVAGVALGEEPHVPTMGNVAFGAGFAGMHKSMLDHADAIEAGKDIHHSQFQPRETTGEFAEGKPVEYHETKAAAGASQFAVLDPETGHPQVTDDGRPLVGNRIEELDREDYARLKSEGWKRRDLRDAKVLVNDATERRTLVRGDEISPYEPPVQNVASAQQGQYALSEARPIESTNVHPKEVQTQGEAVAQATEPFSKRPTNDLGLNDLQQAEWDKVINNANEYGGREGVKAILDKSRLSQEQKDALLARIPTQGKVEPQAVEPAPVPPAGAKGVIVLPLDWAEELDPGKSEYRVAVDETAQVDKKKVDRLRSDIERERPREWPSAPVTVRRIGGRYRLEDGHHRVEVARSLNVERIPAELQDEAGLGTSRRVQTVLSILPDGKIAVTIPDSTHLSKYPATINYRTTESAPHPEIPPIGGEAKASEPAARGLTRNFRAGTNDASLTFASETQRDLYDLAAKDKRLMRGGGERGVSLSPVDTEQLSAQRKALSERMGISEAEVSRLAADTHADVRAQMKGMKDGETRAVVDNTVKKTTPATESALPPEPAGKERALPATEPTAPSYGSRNKVVTSDAATAALERIKARRTTERGSGGPSANELGDWLTLATYHVEAGAREFGDFAKRMTEDVGAWIKPHLADLHDKALASVASGKLPEEYGLPSTTGIARRVEETRRGEVPDTGKGIGAQESVEHGRELLNAGRDPQDVISDFKKTGAISADAMALVRAKHEELAHAANAAYDTGGLNSPEFKAAEKARQDFWEGSVRPMQTEWSNTGRAQQGETAIDTGTFYGLYRAFKQETGREMNPREQVAAKQYAERVAASDKGVGDAERRLIARLNEAAGIHDLDPDMQKALGRFIEESRREARTQKRQTTKRTLDEEAVVIKSNLAAAFKKVTQGGGTHPAGLAALDPEGEITKYVIQYAKNRVKAGVIDKVQLIDDVYSAIKDFADVGKREVAEALAGFGKTAGVKREPSDWMKAKGEVAQGLRAEEQAAAAAKRKAAQTDATWARQERIDKLAADRAAKQASNAATAAQGRDANRQVALQQKAEAARQKLEETQRKRQEKRQAAQETATAERVRRIQEGLARDAKKEGAAQWERTEAKRQADKEWTDVGKRLAANEKLKPEDVKSIWRYANDTYIDKGVEFGETVQNLASDLGATPEQVRRALATQLGVKPLVDATYRKMAARRQVKSAAEQWVKNADRSPGLKAAQGIADAFFNLKTFGHGTVGPVTHAGENIFHPSRWTDYFRNMGRTYRAAYSDAAHERYMQDLVNDPNYTAARRGGLANEPGKFYDEYQNTLAQKMFGEIGKIGNRGFDILKTMRQDFFNSRWDKLDETQKTPEMAKAIADLVNHSTGAIGSKLPASKLTRGIFFAAPLEVSRWARILGDPIKAADAFINWKRATPSDKYFAKSVMKNHAEFLATYLGALALNQAILTATKSDDKINFTDPSKGDWLRLKVKGRAIEPTGGLISTLDFLGKLGQAALGEQNPRETRFERMGQAGARYVRGKLSPVASTVVDVASQSDFMGRPLPFSSDKERAGKPRYSWPEYLITQQSPIPMAEASRDFFEEMHKQGVPVDTTKAIFRAAWNHRMDVGRATGIGAASGSTGVRIGAEYAPPQSERTNPYIQAIERYKNSLKPHARGARTGR